VLVAKEYLDGELAKYETIKDFQKSDLLLVAGLKGKENEFQSLKTRGVDQITILKFLDETGTMRVKTPA